MVRNETVLLGLNQLTNWGILLTDADLQVTGWSRWLENNSGLTASRVVGRPLLEVFPDLVARRLDQFYRQALQGRVVVLAQQLHKYLLPMPPSVEGSRLAHMQQSVRIAPLVEEGVLVGTLTVIEDVTERVAHDAELAARARQQAALARLGQTALAQGDLVPLMDEIAAVVAETLEVEYCAVLQSSPDNQEVVLRAGRGWKAGAVGRATMEAGPDSHVGTTLRSGAPVLIANLNGETRFIPPPLLKEHGIVSGMSVPVVAAGVSLGVVGAYSTRRATFTEEDAHFLQSTAHVLGLAIERHRLEKELRERARQLADADTRKDEFLAMLAHELRNPLAPVRNALHILFLSGSPDPELRYAREVIERQVRQMSRLIDDLLDVSRITRGKVALQKEPIDLTTVVTRAVEISRPLIDARKHRLTLHTPPAPVPVHADLARLSQVVANLLNNAAKFTEEGGEIVLTVQRGQDEAVLRVRDTGVGIAPDIINSIFDLFTQAQGSVSRSEGGLGIGLSLVRSLVEMHGGTVTAFSEGLGRGSEFAIRLPLFQQTAVPLAGEKPLPTHEVPPLRILVVDDNVDAAVSLALLLRMSGHSVQTAHDGLAALELARSDPPQVALLDIGLPRIDGLEVARCMREDLGLRDLFLVAMTGYGQDEDRRRSQLAGFHAHLVKPVDLDALDALLARTAGAAGPGGG